jgi:hypothetical protein
VLYSDDVGFEELMSRAISLPFLQTFYSS